jgi:transposase
LAVIRRDPHTYAVPRARWTLPTLQQTCPWVRVRSPAGLSALLARLGLVWKRARNYIRSPDAAYAAKRAEVERVQAVAAASAGRIVCVYIDEVTIYRQPTLAQSWEASGPAQPHAEYSHRRNTLTRVVGSLNAADGRVVYLRASKIGVNQLVEFYQRVRAAYPQAERIYGVLDNWPVHVHPDLLVALEPQESAWQPPGAPNWRTTPRPAVRRQREGLRLPIQLIWLPTYASWLNPIEKLWRKLQQEEIHLHRLADELERLREGIDGFLDQFANGSAALLRYVGLAVPN